MSNFDHKEINDVIHGRVRLAIMSYLASNMASNMARNPDDGEGNTIDFTHLKKLINVSDGNLSTHPSKLEAAGYLKVTKHFKGKRPQTLCQLTAEGLAAFKAYLSHLESLLP